MFISFEINTVNGSALFDNGEFVATLPESVLDLVKLEPRD